MPDMTMSWLAAVALLCSCEQMPALQVRDIELLHILVAGCLSYREWLERRDMLVSLKLFGDRLGQVLYVQVIRQS